MSLRYQDPSTSHDEATRLLASDVDANVIAALVSIGLNEETECGLRTLALSTSPVRPNRLQHPPSPLSVTLLAVIAKLIEKRCCQHSNR